MSLEIIDPDAFKTADLADLPRGSSSTTIAAQQAAMAAFPNLPSMPIARPRDLNAIMTTMKAYAAAAGENYFYRFPVKTKGGGTDYIEGPSIQLANDLAREWGNCRIDVIVVDAPEEWMIYARFGDVEKVYSLVRPYRQRKSQKTFKTADADRLLDIALQIGVSKAIRGVVCNALQTVADFTFQAARENLVERVGKRLDEYKGRVKEAAAKLGVDIARIERTVGKPFEKWLAPETARVIAELRAISDGMASPDDVWPGEAPARPTAEVREPTPAGAATNGAGETAGEPRDAQSPTTKPPADPTGAIAQFFILYDEVGETEVQNISTADEYMRLVLSGAGDPRKRAAYLENNAIGIDIATAALGPEHRHSVAITILREIDAKDRAARAGSVAVVPRGEDELGAGAVAATAPAWRVSDEQFADLGTFKTEFDKRLKHDVRSRADVDRLVAENKDRIEALGERFPKNRRLLLESVEARKASFK